MHPQFQTDVANPMMLEPLLDQMVKNLSGGELQVRVTLAKALDLSVNSHPRYLTPVMPGTPLVHDTASEC